MIHLLLLIGIVYENLGFNNSGVMPDFKYAILPMSPQDFRVRHMGQTAYSQLGDFP